MEIYGNICEWPVPTVDPSGLSAYSVPFHFKFILDNKSQHTLFQLNDVEEFQCFVNDSCG